MAYNTIDAGGNPVSFSSTTDASGSAQVGATCVTDPSSGAKATVTKLQEQLVTSDGITITHKYAGNFTPAATPTDMIVITGSATMTGRIKRIALGGIATTAGQLQITLIRRSTAPTAGTHTTPTPGKHDIGDAANTLSVSVYTVNPTGLGTTAGNVGQGRLWLPLTTAQPFPLVWDYATREDKAVILRGSSDFICINGNGAALPAGASIDFEIEIEEDLS